MKSLKFLFVAVLAAFVFVSCEKTPTSDKFYEGPIVLNWGNAADVNGKTFEIGMDNWDAELSELVLHVELTNTASEEKTFTLKEVRKYDLTSAFASVCTVNCMPGDGKAEQIWSIGDVAAGEMQQVDLHLSPMTEGDAIFTAEFTFSDGTEEVKFTVNYNYTPAE